MNSDPMAMKVVEQEGCLPMSEGASTWYTDPPWNVLALTCTVGKVMTLVPFTGSVLLKLKTAWMGVSTTVSSYVTVQLTVKLVPT